jgi:hypothetical protein
MRYEIRRFQIGLPDYDAEFWPDTPLSEVKDYADRVVAEGLADRVSVYDGNGTLVMNIPRTLKRG